MEAILCLQSAYTRIAVVPRSRVTRFCDRLQTWFTRRGVDCTIAVVPVGSGGRDAAEAEAKKLCLTAKKGEMIFLEEAV